MEEQKNQQDEEKTGYFFKSKYPDTEPLSHKHQQLSHLYYESLDKHANRVLFVDTTDGRQWTGAQIKDMASRIAVALVLEHGLQVGDICGILYYQRDIALILSLAITFAGGSVSANYYNDPYPEFKHSYDCIKIKFLFSTSLKQREMVRLRQDIKSNFKMFWIDNDANLKVEDLPEGERPAAQLDELLQYSPPKGASPLSIPVDCDPNLPAYILYTSGSTGLPKPVNRSRKSSAYVSVSFHETEKLWKLDHETVMSGHLALDHGTGTFGLKQTVVNGCKLILMDHYNQETLLKNIEKYRITDIMLGSALLQNLMEDISMMAKYDFSSVKNIIAIGSRITSPETAANFMSRHPNCAVRQAYGMTEAGFVSIVSREDSRENIEACGELLSNVKIKLVDRETQEEIRKFNTSGELLVYGPTVSPGYCGNASHRSKYVFLEDGAYRSDDMAFITERGQLRIQGRYSEILCLDDGWKVAPAEIEAAIMEHPWVEEAAVIGMPHPKLSGCHAPRGFVVLKTGHPDGIDEAQICDFVADRVSEPKRLHGGARILKEFPRISIGKVNRKLLKQLP